MENRIKYEILLMHKSEPKRWIVTLNGMFGEQRGTFPTRKRAEKWLLAVGAEHQGRIEEIQPQLTGV